MHINTFGEPEKQVTTPLGPYLTYSFRLILFCYLPLNSIMDGTSNVTEASYFNYDDPDMSGCGSWRSCPANFTCTVSGSRSGSQSLLSHQLHMHIEWVAHQGSQGV